MPGSPDNWRSFNLDDLRNVRLRRGRWYGGPSHERPQHCVDVVDVDVEKPETLTARPAPDSRRQPLMPTATLTRKGQVTIPKAIRDALKVQAGDRLDFVVEGEGRVVMRVESRPPDRDRSKAGARGHASPHRGDLR